MIKQAINLKTNKASIEIQLRLHYIESHYYQISNFEKKFLIDKEVE